MWSRTLSIREKIVTQKTWAGRKAPGARTLLVRNVGTSCRCGCWRTLSAQASRGTALASENRTERNALRSGGFGYIGGLRPFLSLDDLKLHLVALLQALVALGGN